MPALNELVFQALIGTVQTLRDRSAELHECLFQALIGTVQTPGLLTGPTSPAFSFKPS